MKLRLWPRSLVAQLLLAVAAALFVAQAVNLVLLERGQRQQALANGGGMAVARIIDALERDRRGRGDARGDPGEELHRIPKHRIQDTPFVPPPLARPHPDLARHVTDQLEAAGIAAARVHSWVTPHRRHAVKVRGAGP
ncbi:MAG TPA: two-component sensor histidine kinase, partial [Sphingopyxis sp.]|nr:two-component sensor histidine kinase [Sphingopyxis sp.]